jgi:DNA processing protein
MTPWPSRRRVPGGESMLAIALFAADTRSHLVDAPQSAAFERFERELDEVAHLRGLQASGLRWVGRDDPSFPSLLRAIHDPPPGLFVRGRAEIDLLERPAVAVVGARMCSPYGTEIASSIGRLLGAAGVVVVSGLARGVDGAAHRGALAVGGPTVAVLGCGIDRDYPLAHTSLAAEIARTGLIVSEYPPGVEAAPWRFPARNRIVAGLATVTVVVEARERSGALITADFALEEGREVLAVPGEITSALSHGTNALLRLGATPVTKASDVLAAVGFAPETVTAAAPAAQPRLDATVEAVRALVCDAPTAPDEVVRASGLPPAAVAAALSELELLGLVTASEGVYRGVTPMA